MGPGLAPGGFANPSSGQGEKSMNTNVPVTTCVIERGINECPERGAVTIIYFKDNWGSLKETKQEPESSASLG